MRAIEYAFRQGAASLWRSRGSSAFAVIAITLALVVLGVLLLLSWNAQQQLSRWTSASEFSVYLADNATSEQRGALESAIDKSGTSAGRGTCPRPRHSHGSGRSLPSWPPWRKAWRTTRFRPRLRCVSRKGQNAMDA